MTITQKINMDLRKHTTIPGINAVQGDAYTRLLEISLLDDGKTWKIPEGTKLLVQYIRSDGTGGKYDSLPSGGAAATISDNKITLVLAPQMLTAAGLVQVNVTLILNKEQISTFGFWVNVYPNAGSQVEDAEAYYHINGFLPVPDRAQAGQLLRVLETDEKGIVRQVEAIGADVVEFPIPVQQHIDLTGRRTDLNVQTIMLGTPLDLSACEEWWVRHLAVKAVPGTAVQFALFRFNRTSGTLTKVAVIGNAEANEDSGLAEWTSGSGYRVRENNMVILAMADSEGIECCRAEVDFSIVGQLEFEDGNYFDCDNGTEIPCSEVDDGHTWYALYSMDAYYLTVKTLAQYLEDTETDLSSLVKQLTGILPEISNADDGKILKVVDGAWALGDNLSGVHTTVLWAERTVDTFSTINGLKTAVINPPPFQLKKNEVYRVLWDGEEYICSAWDAGAIAPGSMTAVAIGNGNHVGLTGNGEPFMIVYINEMGTENDRVTMYTVDPDDTDTSHIVGIYQDDLGVVTSYVNHHVDRYIREALGGDY